MSPPAPKYRSRSSWASGSTIGLLAAGILLLAGFVVTERRVAHPLLDLSLLRSRVLVGGNLVVLTTGLAAWGLGIITSTYAQNVLGYSPIVFGLGTTAMTLMAVLGARAGQLLLPRIGGRVSVGAAACQLAGCLYLTQLSPHGNYWVDLFPGLLLFGLGLGASFMAGSVAALTGVPDEHAGIASGINTAAFQLGGALGSAVIATVLISTTSPGSPTTPLVAGMVACVAFTALTIAAALLQGRAVGQDTNAA